MDEVTIGTWANPNIRKVSWSGDARTIGTWANSNLRKASEGLQCELEKLKDETERLHRLSGQYQSLRNLYSEERFMADPISVRALERRLETYLDDRFTHHMDMYHRSYNKESNKPVMKTVEQYEDAIEDAQEELRGEKFLVKAFLLLTMVGLGMVLGAVPLVILDILNGFWPCFLPFAVGTPLGCFALYNFFLNLQSVQTAKKQVRLAERAKRDFETAENARLLAEYEAKQARGE
jgi:hypothetical protein